MANAEWKLFSAEIDSMNRVTADVRSIVKLIRCFVAVDVCVIDLQLRKIKIPYRNKTF